MVVMVKQRWLFAGIAFITISFLVFHFHHWSISSKTSPHKLVFVDESCHKESDLEEVRSNDIWAKLRLLNDAFHLAKTYDRTLLIISCTSSLQSHLQPVAIPICRLFSGDPNLVCRTLNPDQVNKHIDQCMSWGDEKLAIMLDRKSNYKRRVYLCESRVSKVPSNLIRHQELTVSERFLGINVTDLHMQNVVNDVWGKVDGMGSLDWNQRSLYLLSDSEPNVSKEGAISINFDGNGNILTIYHGLSKVHFDTSSYETHRNFAILYAALSSRWLWISLKAADGTALAETFLMIEELRRRQGKSYCTSFLRKTLESPSVLATTSYEQWCYDQFRSYFEPLPFSFHVNDPIITYPQIHGGKPLTSSEGIRSSKPYRISHFVDDWCQLFLLLHLRFDTRPFFRYLVFVTTGIVLAVLLAVTKLWSFVKSWRRNSEHLRNGSMK